MQKRIPRILIVEDESIVRLDIQNSLILLGYDVVGAAQSGEDGIAKALELRPDIVLMDIILKGNMDGVTAAEEIRRRLDIPVIFLTACADDKTLQRAKITEPFAFLLKPFEERELHGHIEISLYKHAMDKKIRESEERYSLATRGANDGLWDWNLETREIYYSSRWKSMLGYDDSQIGNAPREWFNRLHADDVRDVRKKLADHLRKKSPHFECEYRILDQTNSYRWMLCRGAALWNQRGNPYRIAGSQTDITDRKVYNSLTGLPNRTLLMDRLKQTIDKSKQKGKSSYALIALDIDDWKNVHDSLGCLAADQLLVQIARKLEECVQSQDTVAHFGSDDFVLLLEEIRDETDATVVASRIHSLLQHSFTLLGQRVYITATLGIVLGEKRYENAADVLRDAYTAVHRAKSTGKGKCEIFNEDMHSYAVTRLKLQCDFRQAIEKGELQLYYQPIVSLKDGQLAGFEALVRWQRGSGFALPEDFLPLAESSELILPMERWVLNEASLQLAKWHTALRQDRMIVMNINLSAKNFVRSELIDELKKVLEITQLPPNSLSLEITESTLLEDSDIVFENLKKVREMNIQVHVDDFGTGYSCLSYLHRYPINALKIDRSFVSDMELSRDTRKIVQTIVMLAQNLDMEIIAEGIETYGQLAHLQSLNCQYGQGYLFSRAVDAATAEANLAGIYPWSDLFVSQETDPITLVLASA